MKIPSIRVRARAPRPVASGTTTASLAGLTADRSHTYGAYDKTG